MYIIIQYTTINPVYESNNLISYTSSGDGRRYFARPPAPTPAVANAMQLGQMFSANSPVNPNHDPIFTPFNPPEAFGNNYMMATATPTTNPPTPAVDIPIPADHVRVCGRHHNIMPCPRIACETGRNTEIILRTLATRCYPISDDDSD